MVPISATILICTAIFIVIYVFSQAIRGTVDLLSTRNLFLAGLIIFQITGAAFGLILEQHGSFRPAEPGPTSVLYTMMLLTFLTIFLVTYKRSTKAIDRLFSWKRETSFQYSDTALLIIAVSTIPLGMLCQYVLIYIPILGPGFRIIGYGLFSVAVGLASWVWFRRFFNPVVFLIAISIILVAMGLTFLQSFGRRPLLGIVMVIGWAAYYSHWRYLGLRKVLQRWLVIGGAGFILLALVTSTREGLLKDGSAIQNLSKLKDASFSAGALDLLTGQNAGNSSMWLIESRPESHPYDTLHTVRLVLFFPIPRDLWYGKPDALAITIPNKELKIPGKPPGWNIGPGLIGHIVNDNPWIALWLYPIFFGVFFRVLDRAVIWFADNPFAVLPMGAALGQIIAIPRGEVGSFFFAALVNILATLVIMLSLSWVLKIMGIIRVQAPPSYWDQEGFEYEYETEYDELQEGYPDALESY